MKQLALIFHPTDVRVNEHAIEAVSKLDDNVFQVKTVATKSIKFFERDWPTDLPCLVIAPPKGTTLQGGFVATIEGIQSYVLQQVKRRVAS